MRFQLDFIGATARLTDLTVFSLLLRREVVKATRSSAAVRGAGREFPRCKAVRVRKSGKPRADTNLANRGGVALAKGFQRRRFAPVAPIASTRIPRPRGAKPERDATCPEVRV